ncbi:MAG: hypothetical protein IT585_10845 [candidate division Zixibacteria bacterium]|nr:hypothetical protein [candidate division Zixibacteria bacterium]
MHQDRTLPDDNDDEQSEIAKLIRHSPPLRLMHALNYSDLPRRAVRVVMHVIVRSLQTDGSAVPAFISLKEFWHYTRVSASHVCDIRDQLMKRNIITVTYPGTARLPYYAVVPDPTEWLVWDEDEDPHSEPGVPDA